MKIRQVEELVGITSKNIRFYEEQGLLSPKRAENGYREYGSEDIDRLRRIKLLRKLGVPIEEISRLFAGTLRLEDCLDRHLDILERQKEDLTKMQTLAEGIIASHATMQSLDIDDCLEQMEQMEKEGTNFMDVERETRKRKKRTGAIGVGVFVVMATVVVPILLLLGVNAVDNIPRGVFIAYVIVSIPTCAAIVVSVVKRIKEIKGGEEDEAVKY